MYIIIPLGGKGERFLKEGYKYPKPLIKVFDKEIISYLLSDLFKWIDKHIDNVYIVYNSDLDDFHFESFIKKTYPFVNLIKLSHQTKGAAETVNIGINEISKSPHYDPKSGCLLLDGDTFYTTNILENVRNLNSNAIFYFNETSKSTKPLFSYITLHPDNSVTDIQEKVKISQHANVGAYYFKSIKQLSKYTSQIITKNITFQNEYYMSCVVKYMLNVNKTFSGIQLHNDQFFSLGTPAQVNEYINNTFAFLFDLDGTLVNSDSLYFDIWKEILQEYLIKFDREIFDTYIAGKDDNTVIRSLIPNLDNNIISSISTKKNSLFVKHIKKLELISNSLQFVKSIKENGHKICIVTNCNRVTAEYILSFFGFNLYVDYLVIGNECSNPKPYPDPYKHALNLLNMQNNKAIIFEDSKSGILSAKGVYPLSIIGIESSFDKDSLINLGATSTIKDYSSISISDVISFENYELAKLKDLIHYNLSMKYDFKDIVIHDTKIKGGYIADIVKITILFKSGSTLDCILKLENNTKNMLKNMAQQLQLYDREYYFYETISHYINVHVPKCYFIMKDQSFNSKGILLENLNTDDFILNLDLNTNSIDVSLTIIDRLAQMHSKFWNKDLDVAFDKLKKTNHSIFYPNIAMFVKSNWETFKLKWANILSTKQIQIGESIVSFFDQIQLYLSQDNLTLCHGDVKSANIFFKILNNKQYEPYFIDWQYVNHGKGVSDLVFFMIESFDIHTLDKFNIIFIEYYYNKVLEYGVLNYDKSTYYKDFILSSCFYPFFVAIWFGVIPQDELIDINFPFFYIQKLFHFLEINNCIPSDYIFIN